MKLLSALSLACTIFAALGLLTWASAYFERQVRLAWTLFRDGVSHAPATRPRRKS